MKVTQYTFTSLEQSPNPSRLFWETDSRKPVFKTPIFDINAVHRSSPDGKEGDFVEIDAPTWVNVIPVFTGTDGQRYFVMERQFRHGSECVTLEFPAGLVEKGESPLEAAKRELEEETGLMAGSMELIGVASPNAAFMNNLAYFYLAKDLQVVRLLGDRNLDENEEIDVLCAPETEILEKMGTGEMDNGIMLMAGFYYLRTLKK